MMRVPLAKGLWLTVATSVVILGLALAGTLASLGCGGGEDEDSDHDVHLTATADVFVRYTMSSSGAKQVPVVGQDVLFKFRKWSPQNNPIGQVSHLTKRTGADGRCSCTVGYTLEKDEYLVCEVSPDDRDSPTCVLKWLWVDANAQAGDTGLAAMTRSCVLALPVF